MFCVVKCRTNTERFIGIELLLEKAHVETNSQRNDRDAERLQQE